MQISEIYSSRQGEGRLTGNESVFVRTSGCNLRCDFCDTPFTSWAPVGEIQSIDEIVEQIESYSAKFVVITGGEPMLPKEIEELTQRLRGLEYHITIETAGTIFKDVECDLMSLSPKMSNSTPTLERAGEWAQKHEQIRNRPETVRRLMDSHDYQLKFVVQHANDFDEILSYLDLLGAYEREKVLLMPEGISVDVLEERSQWVKESCERFGFTFCPRMHIYWYGNKRGT